MVEEFCTALDCVDVGFIPDGLLDALPAAFQLGSTRVGGIDVNKPRTRAMLAAALALAIAPGGFTVADFTAKVRDMTGPAGYTAATPPTTSANSAASTWPANLAAPAATTSRPLPPASSAPCSPSANTSSRPSWPAPPTPIRRTPRHWTDIDRHYQALRLEMMALFADIGIASDEASTTFCRSSLLKRLAGTASRVRSDQVPNRTDPVTSWLARPERQEALATADGP